jgi:hypothetical protein
MGVVMSNQLLDMVEVATVKNQIAKLKKEEKEIKKNMRLLRMKHIACLTPANSLKKIKWKYKELNVVETVAYVSKDLGNIRKDNREWGICGRNLRLNQLHKAIKILQQKGFVVKEISTILNIPATTIYYHVKKIKTNEPIKHNPDYWYNLDNNENLIISKNKTR